MFEFIRFKIRWVRTIDKETTKHIILKTHFFKSKFNGPFAATHCYEKIFYLWGKVTKTVDHFLFHHYQFLFRFTIIQSLVKRQTLSDTFHIIIGNKYLQIGINGAVFHKIILPGYFFFEQVFEFGSFQFPNGLIEDLLVHFKSDLRHKSALFTSQHISRSANIQVAHGDLEAAANVRILGYYRKPLLCGFGQGRVARVH